MRALLHIVIPLSILALGFWSYTGMKGLKESDFKLKPEEEASKKPRRPKPTKIRTHAITLEKQDYTIQLLSQGTTRPHNATTLTAQVSGRIAEISPHFEDGAYFNKGDVLLKIDTADFLTDLESAKAQLARAEAAFAQEEARGKQALLNWRDAGFKEEASDLVLRKPQLREAEANVKSAQSSLDRAQRNLDRTQVKAPYDGRVRKRSVGLGQQIGASTPLGDIFSTDFAEIRLPLTTKDLSYYTPPNKPSPPSKANNVTFSSILTNGKETGPSTWSGSILRAEGALDEDSKQLFIIARIDDPFGLTTDKDPLFIGQPVRATIPAKTLKDVYVIPREALSDLNQILAIRDGKLKRLDIKPLWSGAEHLLIRDGIEPGDQIATSKLPYAPEGAPVEVISPPAPDTDSGQQVQVPKP